MSGGGIESVPNDTRVFGTVSRPYRTLPKASVWFYVRQTPSLTHPYACAKMLLIDTLFVVGDRDLTPFPVFLFGKSSSFIALAIIFSVC